MGGALECARPFLVRMCPAVAGGWIGLSQSSFVPAFHSSFAVGPAGQPPRSTLAGFQTLLGIASNKDPVSLWVLSQPASIG